MKDQYFGDKSDYKKYSILRSLASVGNLSLLVCWMLTEDDGSPDGKHTTYLSSPEKWRRFDPEVFDLLIQNVLIEGIRKVSIVEENGLISNTRYYSRILHDAETQREAYFSDLEKLMRDTGVDVLFLDPDNGMEVRSIGYSKRNSCKYLYWRELESLYRLGSSLLIYQHFSRIERKSFVRNLALEMLRRTSATLAISLQMSHTVFFLLVQPVHRSSVVRSIDHLCYQWGDQIAITQHTVESVKEIAHVKQLPLI